MKTHSNKLSVSQIAELIEQDVLRRGLATGQPYSTAAEVGQNLGIHPRTASRAMKLLAKRGLLERRRHAGTFIGSVVRHHPRTNLQGIQLFVSPDRKRIGLPTGDLMDGLMEGLKTDRLQFNLLPSIDQVGFVREIIEREKNGQSSFGVVLVGCRREIQELVLASGVPAVVFGGVYPSTGELASVDLDQFQLGYWMAKYQIERGHRRIALITRENWLPGDNLLHDGLIQAMGEANSAQTSLVIRSLPMDAAISLEEIVVLFQQENRPTGVVCRGPLFAECAIKAAEIMLLQVPRDVEIVFDYWSRHAETSLPHTYPQKSLKEQAVLVGRMLEAVIQGNRPEPLHIKLPVQPVTANGEHLRFDSGPN